MALHEKIKLANIIKDIHVYLLEKGIMDITIQTEITERKTVFQVTLPIVYHDNISSLEKDLYCCRDHSLEELTWELMIEDDNDSELTQIGLLIDEFNYTETTTDILLTFVRFNVR